MTWIIDIATFLSLRIGWVMAIAVAISLVAAFSMLYVSLKILRKERWVKYLGAGAFTLSLQEGCQLLIYRHDLWDLYLSHPYWMDFFLGLHHLSSPITSLLFLASAYIMLGSDKLKNDFPPAAWVLGFFAMICLPYEQFGAFQAPDVALRVWALGALTWAFYRNLIPTHPKLTYIGMVLMSGYILLVLGQPFGLGIDSDLANHWDEILAERTGLSGESFLSPELIVESASLSFIGLFKVSLFGGGCALAHRNWMSFMPSKEGHEGSDYFGDLTEMTSQVQELTKADQVVLAMWLPGREPKIRRIRWEKYREHLDTEEKIDPKNDLGKALVKGIPILRRKCDSSVVSVRALFKPGSQVSIPVVFEGVTVGCIHCEWEKALRFTASTVVALERIARELAQPMHSQRQLLALQKTMEALDDHELLPLEPLTFSLSNLLLENLTPQGVGIWIQIDGGSFAIFRNARKKNPLKLSKTIQSSDEFKQWAMSVSDESAPENQAEDGWNPANQEFHTEELAFDNAEQLKATLFFAVAAPDEKQKVSRRGILVSDKTFRKALGSMVSDKLVQVLIHDLEKHNRDMELVLSSQDRPALMLHEFKNQMAVVRTILSNLRDDLDYEEYDKAKPRIKEIEDMSASISELTTSMLSKQDLKNQVGKKIDDAIEAACTHYGAYLKVKAIEVERTEASSLEATVSAETLALTMRNLLCNAIDAVKAQSKIHIRVKETADNRLVEIENPGEIPAKDFPKLFDKGFTTKKRGTGMGLHLCRKAMRREGGDIKAHSADDVTVFTVTMPLVPQEGNEEVKHD